MKNKCLSQSSKISIQNLWQFICRKLSADSIMKVNTNRFRFKSRGVGVGIHKNRNEVRKSHPFIWNCIKPDATEVDFGYTVDMYEDYLMPPALNQSFFLLPYKKTESPFTSIASNFKTLFSALSHSANARIIIME